MSEEVQPNEDEVDRRLAEYYWPYYKKIEQLLEDCVDEFGKALFWDAHSIRAQVPTINENKFPDLILGNNDEKTAHKNLIAAALENLSKTDRVLTQQHPI